MSERAAFLRAIRQRPDDDLPRLAYADWLDEQGDPRGEFLRKQCEAVSLYRELQPFLQVPGYSTNPQFLQLKHTFDATVTRSKALEKKHRKEWIPKPLSPDASFQRGFVSEAELTPGEVLGHLETLYQTEPLPDLTLKNHASFARVDELVQLPVLSEVCGLGFSAPVTDAHIAKVLGSPRLGELRRLKLTATKCRTLGIAGLSQAELPQLEELFLANLKLDRLLDLARFPRLKTLHARDNPRLADLGVLSGLSELETLDLMSTHCTDLSPVGSVVSLRKLNLGGVKDLTSLAPLASLTRLEQLWLSMTGVGTCRRSAECRL